MSNSPDEFPEGTPLAVTILGTRESREIVKMGNTLALGSISSQLLVEFPQTGRLPAKTFILSVPEELVAEYGERSYDLYREAHPEAGLPERPSSPPPIVIK